MRTETLHRACVYAHVARARLLSLARERETDNESDRSEKKDTPSPDTLRTKYTFPKFLPSCLKFQKTDKIRNLQD